MDENQQIQKQYGNKEKTGNTHNVDNNNQNNNSNDNNNDSNDNTNDSNDNNNDDSNDNNNDNSNNNNTNIAELLDKLQKQQLEIVELKEERDQLSAAVDKGR